MNNKRKMYQNRVERFPLPAFEDVKEQVIVSLTSYGQRISRIMPTINTLQKQSRKPDKIVIYIAYQDEALVTDELRNANLVEIRFCEDTLSHKKFNGIYDFPDSYIAIADDDLLYHEDWLKVLLQTNQINRKCVTAHVTFILEQPGTNWGRVATRKDNISSMRGRYHFYIMSGPGVLIPPHCDLHELKEGFKFCPHCDEKCLTYLLAYKNIPVLATSMQPDLYHSESYKIPNDALWENYNCKHQKERFAEAKAFIASLRLKEKNNSKKFV